MDKEWVDPIFTDDEDSGELCFDTCERLGQGCRRCERVWLARRNANRSGKSA